MAQASVSGRVTRLLLNPNGDVDGFLLEDGTQVATPPHWSARIVDVIKGHDPVTVTGQRANDGSVVRAAEVRADASGRSVTDNGPDGAPPVPREPSPLVPLSANGRIAAVLHTDRGDVDGVVLENGTSVRFPPPAGVQFSDLLKPGQMLYAEGYGTTNDLGRALEATQLGASRRGRQEVFAPPPGPDGGLPVGRPVVPPPPGIAGQP
ncbi:MAG TPA: hypothetical protein VH328_00775 [Burkholderiaceae bacterium]|nr:hypothetical protein [Burkholderiaceae bacterium]